MFFYFAKVVWFVAQPSSLILLILVLGFARLVRSQGRRGRRMLACGLLLYAVCGFSPLANLAALGLEMRIPRVDAGAFSGRVDGIVVLGGGEERAVLRAQVLGLNEAAERMTEAVLLARRFPDAKLVFTGGSARLGPARAAGTEDARDFFAAFGIAASRIVVEDRSRDTWENAAFTRELLGPVTGQRWLLVTSASHMPRALGCFRKVGFAVEPYLVDWQTGGWADAGKFFDCASEGLRQLDRMVREYVGLAAYRLAGRTDELFPGQK